MSDIQNQEQLRDSIASVLELSRQSWKLKKLADDIEEEDRSSEPFPRSILLKTLTRHPLASAATIASIWYFGPARFGAMTAAGIGLFIRHRASILPIAEQLLSTAIFNTQTKTRSEPPPRD